MSELNFSWKFKDFWISSVHEKWNNEKHDYDRRSRIKYGYPIEVCKYNPGHNTRYTVAIFEKDSDGYYELRSVRNRLFDDIDASEIADIWVQLQAVQKMLDAYSEATYHEEDD